jgi:hypothetical protein
VRDRIPVLTASWPSMRLPAPAGTEDNGPLRVLERIFMRPMVGVVVGSFDQFAGFEACAGADECDQVGCVHRAPAGLC